jgi:hypothetical protein
MLQGGRYGFFKKTIGIGIYQVGEFGGWCKLRALRSI